MRLNPTDKTLVCLIVASLSFVILIINLHFYTLDNFGRNIVKAILESRDMQLKIRGLFNLIVREFLIWFFLGLSMVYLAPIELTRKGDKSK
jgi:hypothetical protein